jgi:hypothetical protein
LTDAILGNGAGTQVPATAFGTGTVTAGAIAGVGAGVQVFATATGTLLLVFEGGGAGTQAAPSGSSDVFQSLPELDSVDTVFGSSPIGSIFDPTLPLEVAQ